MVSTCITKIKYQSAWEILCKMIVFGISGTRTYERKGNQGTPRLGQDRWMWGDSLL